MNYLYSQESLGNNVEGCAAGYFIRNTPSFLTFNKNVLKLWKYCDKLVLVKEVFLYEKILQVCSYNLEHRYDGIAILFDKAKLTLSCFNMDTYDFDIISLKFFEKDEFDIRNEDSNFFRVSNNLGMLKISRYNFTIFSLFPHTFPASIFKFTDINEKIRNPIDFIFIDGYSIPTVCLLYNANPARYTSAKNLNVIVFSIDLSINGFHIVDEFMAPPQTFKVVCSKGNLLFLSPNSIVARTINSCHTHPLNSMMESYYIEPKSKECVLFNAQCYFKNENCFIFNGNGDIYSLKLNVDIKKIIGITAKYIEKSVVPSCIGVVEDMLFLGTFKGNSKLFKIIEVDDVKEEVKEGDRSEYERIFGKTKISLDCLFGNEDDDSLMSVEEERMDEQGDYEADTEKKNINLILNVIDEIYGTGGLNGTNTKNTQEIVFASEGLDSHAVAVINYLAPEIKKSVKIKGYSECFVADDYYLLTNDNESIVFMWNEILEDILDGEYTKDLKTILFSSIEDGIIQITEKNCRILEKNLKLRSELNFMTNVIDAVIVEDGRFILVKLEDNVLFCYSSEMKVKAEIRDVSCYTVVDLRILYISKGKLYVFDLLMMATIYESGFISVLPNSFKLIPFTSCALIETAELDEDQLISLREKENFLEMICYKTEKKLTLFFRLDTGLLICYQAFVTKNWNIKKITDFSIIDVVFSKIWLNDVVLFSQNYLKKFFYGFDTGIYIKSKTGHFCFITDRGINIYKSKYYINSIRPLEKDIVQLSKGNLAISTVFLTDKYEYEKYLIKNYKVQRIAKNIEHAGDYNVIASCIESEFGENEGGVKINTYKFYLDLYTFDYKFISSYEMDNNEFIFDVKYFSLNDTQGTDGKSNFLVVCTTFIEGEDKPAKGRLHVFEIISVVPEPGQPFKDRKLKLLSIEKTKGSIVQCEEIRGNIALCLGTKIMIYSIDRSKGIIPIGFHDLHIFTTSITVIKNYILASDIYRGLSFFYLHTKPIKLTLLSCSNPIPNTVNVKFLLTGEELSLISSDYTGNIHIYTYSPNNILSLGGSRLVKRARIKTKLGTLVATNVGFKQNSILLFSKNAMFSHIKGLDDDIYYKLLNFQMSIVAHFNAAFGINVKDYLDPDVHLHEISLKTPISQQLLTEFLYLDSMAQDSVCQMAKITKFEAMRLYEHLS